MHPSDLSRTLRELRDAGMTSAQLTRMHHFSLKRRPVSMADAIGYFEGKNTLLGNNIPFADRCCYVAEQVRARRLDLDKLIREALARLPLEAAAEEPEPTRISVHAKPIGRARSRAALAARARLPELSAKEPLEGRPLL